MKSGYRPQSDSLVAMLDSNPGEAASRIRELLSNHQRIFVVDPSTVQQSGLDVNAAGRLFSAMQLRLPHEKNQALLEDFVSHLCGQKSLPLHSIYLLLSTDWLYQVENVGRMRSLILRFKDQLVKGKPTLAAWLRQLDVAQFRTKIENCQNLLSTELLKLSLISQGEMQIQEDEAIFEEEGLLSIQIVLLILWQANTLKKRVQPQQFYNREINNLVPVDSQLRNFLTTRSEGNFLCFPFLLDLQFKQKLLEAESRLEMMHSIKKEFRRNLFSFIGGDLGKNSIFLLLEVNRATMLEQSLQKLASTNIDLKKPLKVVFTGEPGDDLGGPRKEYFQLMIKKLLDLNFGMFQLKGEGKFLWFNGKSWEAPVMFQLIGIIIGLAIYSSNLLELHFPPFFYSRLLTPDEAYDIKACLRDLAELDPQIHKGLMHLLDPASDVSESMLFFEAKEEIFGTTYSEPLMKDGEKIAVTNDNKEEYVMLYAEYLLKRSVQKQFNSFRKGFFKAVSPRIVNFFTGPELESLLCGLGELDFNELREGTIYEEFDPKEQYMLDLWEILLSFEEANKKKFLSFVTGSDRAPVAGLKSLELVIKRNGPDSDNLPTAHTCFNVLMLPCYSSKERLKQKILLSLQHNEGFGLI